MLGDAVLLPEPTELELLLGGSGVLWCDFAVSGHAGHAHDAEGGANPILACLALAAELRVLERELNAARAEGERALRRQHRHDQRRRLALELAHRRHASACAWGSPPAGTAEAASAPRSRAVERATSAPTWPGGRERGSTFDGFRAVGYALDPEHALARALATRTRRCTAPARAR